MIIKCSNNEMNTIWCETNSCAGNCRIMLQQLYIIIKCNNCAITVIK